MTDCHIVPVCVTHDVLATDWSTADDGPTATAHHPTCPLADEPTPDTAHTLDQLTAAHVGWWIGRTG